MYISRYFSSWVQIAPTMDNHGTIYFRCEDGSFDALYTIATGIMNSSWLKLHYVLQNTGQSPYATTTAPLFPDDNPDLFP